MSRHQVKARVTVGSLAELAEVTAQWSHERHGPVTIRARITTPSGSAASTIAAQWVLHGGRSVVIEIYALCVRVPLDRYGRRRWWWSR